MKHFIMKNLLNHSRPLLKKLKDLRLLSKLRITLGKINLDNNLINLDNSIINRNGNLINNDNNLIRIISNPISAILVSDVEQPIISLRTVHLRKGTDHHQ